MKSTLNVTGTIPTKHMDVLTDSITEWEEFTGKSAEVDITSMTGHAPPKTYVGLPSEGAGLFGMVVDGNHPIPSMYISRTEGTKEDIIFMFHGGTIYCKSIVRCPMSFREFGEKLGVSDLTDIQESEYEKIEQEFRLTKNDLFFPTFVRQLVKMYLG